MYVFVTDVTQMLMLSEAYLILSGHPSTHPSKSEGFAQDDHRL
jgi:hypothetical protein